MSDNDERREEIATRKFRYGCYGPNTGGALVLQNRKGDDTTVIAEHRISLNPDDEKERQYIGTILLGEQPMTLYAFKAKDGVSDPPGTIRMKRVTLI